MCARGFSRAARCRPSAPAYANRTRRTPIRQTTPTKAGEKICKCFFRKQRHGRKLKIRSLAMEWTEKPLFFQKSCVLGDFLLNPNKLMVQVEAKEKLLHNFCKYDILLLIRYMLTF